MKCAEFKENVEAYALGALDAREREACDAHLASPEPHQGCHAALARAFDAAALLAESLESRPPSPQVWQAIENEIRRTSEAPGGGTARARAAFRWREAVAWGFAVAATVALILSNGARKTSEERLAASERSFTTGRDQANVALRGALEQRETCLRELATVRAEVGVQQAAVTLINNPASRLVQLAPQGGVPYRGSAIVNPAERRAMLLASALASQPGKDYELWLIYGNEKVPAGLLRAPADGAMLHVVDHALLARGVPDAFAVTIEPEGGQPQPTGPIVLVGAMPKV